MWFSSDPSRHFRPAFRPVLLVGILLLVTPLISANEPVVLVRPHGDDVIYLGSETPWSSEKGALTERFEAAGMTFNITYEDMGVGFTDPDTGAAVRDRLKDVLAYVAETINYSGRALDIQVTESEFDGSGALASAGTFYPMTPGFHPGSTLRRLNTGLKPFIGFPEISITVDKGFAWNVGAGDPAPGTADFFSVLLHEMTHGLGFTSLVDADGSSTISPNVYTVYDRFLTDGTDGSALFSRGPVPTFQANVSSLTSEDVWFGGSQARARYTVDAPIPVHAPNPYQPGSSISHWDVNFLQSPSVMTHALQLGTAQREYAGVDLGTLIDLGYNRIDGAPSAGLPGCTAGKSSVAPLRSAGGDVLFMILAGVLTGYLGRSSRIDIAESQQ